MQIITISDADLRNVTGGNLSLGERGEQASPPSNFGDWGAKAAGKVSEWGGKAGNAISSEWGKTKDSFSNIKQTFGKGIMNMMGLGR